MLFDSLVTNLSIYEKSLAFDFTAIMLNETLDDPTTTNIPSSWKVFVEDPNTIRNLFRILKCDIRSEKSSRIKFKAC